MKLGAGVKHLPLDASFMNIKDELDPEPEAWNTESVNKWLNLIGMDTYASIFEGNKINIS